jgi:hypothetical protein
MANGQRRALVIGPRRRYEQRCHLPHAGQTALWEILILFFFIPFVTQTGFAAPTLIALVLTDFLDAFAIGRLRESWNG